MQLKDLESKLVHVFRNPNIFPKKNQSYDGRIQTFANVCNRLSLNLGAVFDNYVDYIYNNGYDILFLYQILVIARRYSRAPYTTVIDYAKKEWYLDKLKKETEGFRNQLELDVVHYAISV